ncbi:PREDICTED: EIN3-binding F-box protein 1-like [Nelumbo nucifera]|uniref:EIN3-binding F-box protein 1-like n=1 Tax=Nelumbo nucifera TaxID=4432 RepID=A0A1U7ZJE7_NELNU|nr:PREDICTED: EIN3-binding F-box protein 1-like [Nelumbo nucifera]
MDQQDGGGRGGEGKYEEMPFNQQEYFCNFSNKRAFGNYVLFDLNEQKQNNNAEPPNKKRSRHQETSISDKISTQDLISYLPDECIWEIFRYLPSTRDRCCCAAVSKKWLAIQAKMRISEFKSKPKSSNIITSALGLDHHKGSQKFSRCLEGKKANDTRLAAMAVGICLHGGLSELCVRGSFPTQGITDVGLSVISQACPGLRSISLWDCIKVGNKGIVSVATSCSSLEKLDLVNLPLVDDKALASIAKNCPSLSSLVIELCPLVGDTSLEAFARYSSKIEFVSLAKCQLINASAVILIISSLPKLTKLKLSSVSISDGVLQVIGTQGKSLSCILVDNISGITEVGFCSIGEYKNLNFLPLKSCSDLNGSSLNAISDGFVGLKKISMRKCKSLTDDGLKWLTKTTPLLESLELEECHSVTWHGLIEVFRNRSETLKALSLIKCRGIADVDPSNCKAISLPKYPCLHSLVLKKCDGVGDTFLAWMGRACLQVKHLTLTGLKSITDQGVENLIRALETEQNRRISVDLSGCSRITDWSVFVITSLIGDKLRSLMLDWCEKLTDLSLKMIAERCACLLDLGLSGCRISDDGVYCLVASKLQCLEVVSFAGCVGISDQSLHYLRMLRCYLVGLNLMHCPKLTKEGIDRMRENLWWCDLLH